MEQQIFDVETGMPVHGGNGVIIGTVTEIAGFGSTRIPPASGGTGAQVTEAQSGTGYVRVVRPDGKDLYVPFHGIEKVITGQGVYLTASMIDELKHGADTLVQPVDAATQPGGSASGHSRQWRLRRPAWSMRGQAEAKAAAPTDAKRGKS